MSHGAFNGVSHQLLSHDYFRTLWPPFMDKVQLCLMATDSLVLI